MVSVAFVDDHPVMLAGIASLFAEFPDSQVAAVGTSAKDIVEIAVQHRPDVIIADLCMPGNAFEAIAIVNKIAPLTKIIAFTASRGVETALRALDAGARAYVLKGATTQELLKAVQCVQAGEMYITDGISAQVIAALSGRPRPHLAEAEKLSTREDQVIRLLLRGKTNKEIAAALNISLRTVKHYMTVLMQKLHVRNRLEVVLAAQRLQERMGERGGDAASGNARPNDPGDWPSGRLN